ncbi:LacI family DNA-binding transcriptional regulator [Paenibacillus sp. N1-5-1-14]|uniref:LacI family DNA-binding transcriptional regulator n=1 Tax=Paenibacillus radicibacter TaxID=2972488 RepID=UPI0021598546|nr:LacI family DNA-binding transcriptional regulator [Paenibacillus radicibacter]MCR8645643.1 LacI family DNA-binding transcriptional regulator [Paenibacillus radicibacter]
MANIKQIAQIAGVSITTVSRVLNNHPYVKPDKREAVLQAIRQLNYTPNQNAVQLVKGHTSMIGVVVPFVNHHYFGSMIEGIAQQALEYNYQLVLCQTQYEQEEERKVLEMLRRKQIDGVIICSKVLEWELIESYLPYGPIITCENAEGRSISSVYVDHYNGFAMGVNYLITKGHHRIGYTIGRPESNNSHNRIRAFHDQLATIDQVPNPDWIFNMVYTFEDGTGVLERIMQLNEKPTAILVAGDIGAAGIISSAKKHGVRVPEDLAVIGFDDQPISRAMDITTIKLPTFEVGRLACETVYKQLIGECEQPHHQELPIHFIPRSTV